MKKNTKRVIKYLIEFLIVAFGVFLGIYASGRENENRITENKEKTIKNVVKELENNRENLQNSIEYHELIKANLDSILQTIPREIYFEKYIMNQKFQFNKIKGWTGNGFAALDNTAFEVAKMSGAMQNMDIELTQEISKIYKRLKTLSDFQKSINNKIANLNSETKIIDVIGSIKIVTGDNLGMEKQLSNQLEQTIKIINTSHNKGYD